MGRGGGQVVSLLAFYPMIRVLVPVKSTIFLYITFETTKVNKKGQDWSIFRLFCSYLIAFS